MGALGTAVRIDGCSWPPSGLPMGQFRTSPYRCLTGPGPLRYVEYTQEVLPKYVLVPGDCIHSSSCFTCPLSDCHYTQKESKRSVHTRSLRDDELIRLRQEGYSVKELVELFGISKRMVYRVLQSVKKEALHVNSG